MAVDKNVEQTKSSWSLFGVLTSISETVYDATVSVAKSVVSFTAAAAVGSTINEQNVKEFLKVIQKEEKFQGLMVILLKNIYKEICIRYIPPVIFLVFLIGVSVSALYYNGILRKCEQYVTKFLDSFGDSVEKNLINFIRHTKRFIRLGRTLKTGSDGLNIHPVNYNLRDAYEQLHKDGLSVVDGLKDPVKIHFGAM